MSAFRELSTTASANTAMGGYNTAEGMARADVNEVLRWIGKSGKELSASVPVSVVEYGAVGNGTTDDTVALNAALATGKNVYIPDGMTFKFTSDITLSTNYQRFGGPGVLKPEGNCGVVISGATAVEVDLTFENSAHTGIAVTVSNSNRTRIRRLYGTDVFSALYVTKANTTTVDWLWATCRGYGIKWYGDNTNRSDIFSIGFALVSVPQNQYGFDWDGNCHSLIVHYLGIVCGGSVSATNGKGFVVRNTSGGTAPAIARLNHIEVDYSGTHGIDIQAGSDIDINIPYVLGCSGDGIRVGASINNREVRVSSGKSRGNTGYGINALGGVVLYDGVSDLQSNTSGASNGSVWTEPIRVALDANAYYTLSGGNPQMVFDTNDYYVYDRTNNLFTAFVSALGVFRYGLAGFGYATGSGGTVTQTTSRTTGVTLNKPSGAITLVSAAGSAAWTTFTVTNNCINSGLDTIVVSQKSGTDDYMFHVTNVGSGAFDITFATTGGTTTEQPVFNFAVVKAVAS